ncbi:transposase, partial [Providencia rettgeri]|nr:transposase [Providencia rettgeri]
STSVRPTEWCHAENAGLWMGSCAAPSAKGDDKFITTDYLQQCPENYIKEAKYDMAVGHLLLKSFWANEAVFQMMMLSYNLFLLFKFDSLDSSEYRQQIKTFRLKYVFLAAKIIKTARYVIMKLSENYPYKGVYEKCLV